MNQKPTDGGAFVLITGIGHHGSYWLKHVLDRPDDGVVFGHEMKQRLCGRRLRLLQAEERRGIARMPYQKYWDWVNQMRQQYRIVGDANSFTTTHIPEVHDIIGIDRILYFLRNGVQQIEGMRRPWSSHSWMDEDWYFDVFLRNRWKMLGSPFVGRWSPLTKWEKACFRWWMNAELAGWLKKQIPGVEVWRMEDFTGTAEGLAKMIQSFGLKPERLEHWLKWRPRPPRKGRDTSVKSIWKSWSQNQRQAFIRFCGDKMIKLGYEML